MAPTCIVWILSKLTSDGAILINAFSRSKSLNACLESIEVANRDFKLPIFVIFQTGFSEVKAVLENHNHVIKKVVEVDGNGRTALENINWNRYLGYEILFNIENQDWVIAIEEDVAIAPDSIKMALEIYNTYSANRAFRGINFGSREPFDFTDSKTYSLLRYGLHGQASLLPKSSWRKFSHKRMKKKFSTHGFDSLIEFTLKKGFMVTPNHSRSLDMGWDGTHVPSDSSDPYFVEMAASYVGDKVISTGPYILKPIQHRWRDDIKIFRHEETFNFVLSARYYLLKHQVKRHLIERFKGKF